MRNNSSLRTPLKRARGLGAAHSGTHHFWVQRVTAVAIIPLAVWFVVTLISKLLGAPRAAVSDWLQQPLVALALASLLVAMFAHARLGLQVIIEDYVANEGKKIALLLLTNALIIGCGAASLMAIFHLHFFGIK